ncbi:MAG: GTPase [Acaryochloris sp. SU_5_25]|nr:GTPase [Acaryochloris sp. SU_5_25]
MPKLIFVYNANSGAMNLALDIAHKVISPDTYSCNLCMLTHDTFTERSAWKSFREAHNIPMEFLHKDEFEWVGDGRFAEKSLSNQESTYTYPIILKEDRGHTEVFLETVEINGIKDVKDLIATIQQRLEKLGFVE